MWHIHTPTTHHPPPDIWPFAKVLMPHARVCYDQRERERMRSRLLEVLGSSTSTMVPLGMYEIPRGHVDFFSEPPNPTYFYYCCLATPRHIYFCNVQQYKNHISYYNDNDTDVNIWLVYACTAAAVVLFFAERVFVCRV